MRILVVEDEKKIATFVQHGLKECGFVVDVVHRGDEALDIILDHHFDAVVLDIMLPGRDGLSILRVLRERAISGRSPNLSLEVGVTWTCLLL